MSDASRPSRPTPPVPPAEARRKRTPAERARAAVAAAEGREGVVHETAFGPIRLAAVRHVPASGRTPAHVEVVADGPSVSDPHFRVVNPPRFVQDPNGDIEIAGRRFREDPLAALAEAIGRAAANQSPSKRRGPS